MSDLFYGKQRTHVARNPGFSVLVLMAGMAIGLMAVQSFGEIPWRSTTDGGLPAQASASQALQQLAAAGDGHVLLRFGGPVGPEVRQAVRAAGVELLSYVGDNAFFAAVSAERLDPAALEQVALLRGAQAIEREFKLHPMLARGEVPAWAVVGTTTAAGSAQPEDVVGAYVIFHSDVTLDPDGIELCRLHGGDVRSRLSIVNGAVIELPYSQIEALVAEDAVQWIEPPLPRMSPVNDSNRARTQADLVQAAPYNLTGAGVTVLVYDGGTGRSTHVDFQGRLFVRDSSGMADHSTHVAGTIGGAGVANASYKGMAPGVTIESYGFEYDGSGVFLYTNPGDLQADYTQAVNTYGAVIASNSIGTNTESNGFDCAIQGDYGVTDQLIDSIVRGSLGAPLRVVWAAGNERQGSRCDVEGYGDYYSTAPPGTAKNHITVGALNSNDDTMTSFSSWGPTDDGRLKPDISGPGCQSNGDGGVTSCSSSGDTAYTTMCGTSMACPTVAGCSALIIQDFRVQYPGRPLFRNSTLKTWLAHTAVDLGNAGPDYQYGYGSIRVKDAIDFMRTGSFREESLAQGETYTVYVPVSSGTSVLKVTMAWDDYPGTPNVTPALVNDLDLRVYDPSNGRHYPWTLNPTNPSAAAVQTAEDHTNNIEQVLVNSPAAGLWRVEVYGYNVPQGPQPFSLCASPALTACSSQGTITLDAAQYDCSDAVGVSVVDCDLNTNNNVVETVSVTITSATEPGGESMVLTETGPATATFHGTIGLSTSNSAGVLQVTHDDTVTAHYIDANNGQGGYNVEVTASAGVDCQGPVISNVQVSGIGSSTATVTFTTSEAANGTVRWGLSCGSLGSSSSDSGYGTAHSISLSGLPGGSLIYFSVEATDPTGNLTTDNNGGACYSFTTTVAPGLVYSWSMDTNPGWTISGGTWAWGVPAGAYGDPSSGHTGANVYGYNLNGRYANNIPEYNLTTTAINCANLTQVSVKFWRWLGVEDAAYDHAYVRVSNDNANWTPIWQNPTGSDLIETAWSQQSYDISAVADNHATVYVRWVMGTSDAAVRYCGWNIDDVEIWGLTGTPADTTPPTPNPMTFASAPAPASTSTITMTATTATDAGSPPVSYFFNFVSGGAGGNDSAWQAETGYTDSGLSANTAYTYRVKARDSAATPNETTYSGNAATATYIQSPTAVTFGTTTTNAIVLNASGTFTNLTTGSSGLWFDSTTTGGDGGINAWVQTTTDTATGLAANSLYTFQVKARNQNGVETAYSGTASQPTLIETPTGVSFGTVTSNSIVLNATGTLTNLTVGTSGVYFDSTTTGGDGGINAWVQAPSDTANGLSPDTAYTFQVKARSQNSVETAYSTTASQRTLAAVPAAPTLSNATTSSMQLDVNANGNPATTVFAIQCTGATPPDANWNGLYVNTTGNPSAAAVWQTDATWGVITVTGLAPETTYTFAVKARNGDGIATAFGPGASLATLPLPTGACCNPTTGACTIVTQAACTAGSGVYQGDNTSCTPNPCPQPTGACCDPTTGACTIVTQAACRASAGVYQGDNASCTPNPCPQPTGACCNPTTGACTIVTQADCTTGSGVYEGDNTSCTPNPCTQPCLLTGDVNVDGVVNGLDIEGFVRAKLGLPPLPGENEICADYGTGTLDGDIAAFVADLIG